MWTSRLWAAELLAFAVLLFLKEKHPKSKVLVLERGLLPQGASTKNAGFACFGSISEILSDVKQHSEQEVQKLIQDRYEGIQLLRRILGDKNLAYQQNGGYEVFLKKDNELYEQCIEKLDYANDLLKPIFKVNVFDQTDNVFDFENVKQRYITHIQEGQIDTGKMMISLLKLCTSKGVFVLNGFEVENLRNSKLAFQFYQVILILYPKKYLWPQTVLLQHCLNKPQVKPARAQVLITEPIPNLKIKGTFHLEEGYYYFRNVDNRILLGGGRNLDFKGEETTLMGETESIQSALENLLKEVILPKQPFEIAQRWSGIMGVGNQKTPIIEQVSTNVFCGVRLGGMGVALGSLVGKDLAGMI